MMDATLSMSWWTHLTPDAMNHREEKCEVREDLKTITGSSPNGTSLLLVNIQHATYPLNPH